LIWREFGCESHPLPGIEARHARHGWQVDLNSRCSGKSRANTALSLSVASIERGLAGDMTREIQVFEPVTSATFNARRYLLANIDLRRAFGNDEAMAQRHFYENGFQENRRQITAAFLSSQREKFVKFKDILPECDSHSFPLFFGESFHNLSDYNQGESSNGMLGFWSFELDENPEKLYADIGSGLRPAVWLNCAYVEVYPSTTADILIEPNCKLPFKDASLDGIGCFAVLEHVDKPWEMADEFGRVVKPGGKIFIDWPFLQPLHGYPSHYYNATREGLRSLFVDRFDIDELYTGAWQGPDYTVSWILNALLSSIKDDGVSTRFSKMTIGDICKQPPQSEMWNTLLASLDERSVSMLSCGNMLVATKKSSS
jgi:SAM-dependent methyltransferase